MLKIGVNWLTNPCVRTLSVGARALLVDVGVAAANGGLGKLSHKFNDLDGLYDQLWSVFGSAYPAKDQFDQWVMELHEAGFVSFDSNSLKIFFNWHELEGFRPEQTYEANVSETDKAVDRLVRTEWDKFTSGPSDAPFMGMGGAVVMGTPGGSARSGLRGPIGGGGGVQGVGLNPVPDHAPAMRLHDLDHEAQALAKEVSGIDHPALGERPRDVIPVPAPSIQPTPVPSHIREKVMWESRVRAWQLNPRTWRGQEWGPEPDQPGTLVPKTVYDPS